MHGVSPKHTLLRVTPRAGPSTLPSRRRISSTAVLRATHYETLSVPHHAHLNQIKSNFYKLSKELHPDLNKQPDAKEKYVAVTEAYHILSDGQRRRAYDRTLSPTSSPSTSHHPHTTSRSGSAAYHAEWAYNHPQRGATYAWANKRNRPPPGWKVHDKQRHKHYDPSGGASAGGGAAGKSGGAWEPPRTGWERTRRDEIEGLSTFSRFGQVTGLLIVVGMLANFLANK
ncbi:DnaJ-domain-containing protein [Peniophora sp. CONT]|nr:DnaJ-domain-containing protein [Peniophora sp. CONT]